MKKHNVVVRHVKTDSSPRITTNPPRSPEEIARRLFLDADEWGWKEVISIEVDGKVFLESPREN